MRLVILKPNAIQYTNIMVCFVFGFNILMYTFNNIVRLIIGNTFYLDSIFIYGIYVFCLFKMSTRILNSFKTKHFAFLALIVLMPLVFCSNGDVKAKILSEMIPFALLAFTYSISISDYQDLWGKLYKYSWIVLGMVLIDVFALKSEGTSHMIGYGALFPACVLSIETFYGSKNRIRNIVGVFLSTVVAIQANTSGALAAVALTIILYMFYVMKKYKSFAVLLTFLFSGIAIIVSNNITALATFLSGMLSRYGVNINALDEIASSGLSTDIYRDSIYQYCWKYSTEHWFWGCGVGNDRYLITENTLVRNQTLEGNYPHNIFLELTIQFGLILGVILCLILIIYILKYLLVEQDETVQKIAVLFVGMGFFPLFYSSSYLENAMFFLLIGFIWRRKQVIKEQRLRVNRDVV